MAVLCRSREAESKPKLPFAEDSNRPVGPVNKSVNDQGRVLMIGDSLRRDRNGPRQAGIGGVHLRRGTQISNLVGFAQAVLEYEQPRTSTDYCLVLICPDPSVDCCS